MGERQFPKTEPIFISVYDLKGQSPRAYQFEPEVIRWLIIINFPIDTRNTRY